MTTTTVTLTPAAGDPRQIFTRPAFPGVNQGRPATYRVAQIGVLADGSVWIWAEQLTKAGQPYKSGMGLTLGNEDRLAEIYGQDVADVVAEAVAAHELDETMREQIATAQPCDECGDLGHAAADHDVEPTAEQVELERVLRASLPQCAELHNPGVWPYVARCVQLATPHTWHEDSKGRGWSA